MSRRPARFTQADLHRAIRAVVQSGAAMAVEIGLDGTIRIAPNVAESLTNAEQVAPRRQIAL